MGIEGYYEDYFDDRQDEKLTNFQKIKNMSLDEMAEFIKCTDCFYCPVVGCKIWTENEEYTRKMCDKYAKQWLQQESEV